MGIAALGSPPLRRPGLGWQEVASYVLDLHCSFVTFGPAHPSAADSGPHAAGADSVRPGDGRPAFSVARLGHGAAALAPPRYGQTKLSPRPERVLVVQPLPGIGDMVWHLAHIRALAEHYGGPVTLLAKPRSLADQLLAGEPAVRDIVWLDRNPRGRTGRHDGPGGLGRLVLALRAGHFDRAIMLHHSHTLALAALAAGIPARHGYGFGAQRWFLNHGPYMPEAARRLHQLERATAFLRAANIPLDDPAPRLEVAASSKQTVAGRLADAPRPLVAMGIGSSETHRQWGPERMAALGRELLQAGWGELLLIGGPDDEDLARSIRKALGPLQSRARPILGWHLSETTAALQQASLYVGNNTGVMNMAAAVGIPTYALFGTTPPFFHSANIVPIVAAPGPDDGMARVNLSDVLSVIVRDRGGLTPVGSQAHSQP